MSISYSPILRDWATQQLTTLVKRTDHSPHLSTLLSFTSPRPLIDYATLNISNSEKCQRFIQELWKRMEEEREKQREKEASEIVGMTEFKRQTSSEIFKGFTVAAAAAAGGGGGTRKGKGDATSTSSSSTSGSSSSSSSEEIVHTLKTRTATIKYVKSKRSKNSDAASGSSSSPSSSSSIDRVPCNCECREHNLFTNCTACGRIICEAEGEGHCFFCGSYVTANHTQVSQAFVNWMTGITPMETETIGAPGGAITTGGETTAAVRVGVDIGTSQSAEEAAAREAGLVQARAQKDKLLHYSHTDVARSSIVDDQSDYYEFESNVWLTNAQQQEKKKAAEDEMNRLHSRASHRITLDLVNRSVKAEETDPFRLSQKDLQVAAAGPVFRFEEEVKREENKRDTAGGARAAAAAADSAAERRAAAIRSSGAGAAMREELQIVSKAQYYRNDTLYGRAKAVYEQLKQSLAKPSSSSSSDSLSLSARSALVNNSFSSSSSSTATALSRLQHSDMSEFGLLSVDEAEMGIDWEEEKEKEKERRKQWELEQQQRYTTFDEDEPDCSGSTTKSCSSNSSTSSSSSTPLSSSISSFLDSTDNGMTLSMTQPWASLLVLGIKRFEGRGWSTSYRGRLWIASTAQEADPDTVEAVEDEYETVYSGLKVPFPSSYPKSALLGCVDLVDCITNEQFQSLRLQHLKCHRHIEDSQSAFIFVCTNPRVLSLPQRISGQHKLWNIPTKLMSVVQSGLKAVDERWRIGGERQDGASSSSSSSSSSRFEGCIRREPIDIWPSSGNTRALISTKTPSPKPTPSLLAPGLVLIRQFLSLTEQQQLIDIVRTIGISEDNAFYVPIFPGVSSNKEGGGSMNLKMLCLGKRWNHVTHKYDSDSVRPIPAHFLSLISSLFQYLSTSFSSAFPSSQLVSPDICIINFYPPSKGRLGVHRDQDESAASIKQGCAVVSVSVGDTAEFVWSKTDVINKSGGGAGTSATNGANILKLASGDVLLFAGESRLMYHGVERILANSAPKDLFIRPGRLNLTFRKF